MDSPAREVSERQYELLNRVIDAYKKSHDKCEAKCTAYIEEKNRINYSIVNSQERMDRFMLESEQLYQEARQKVAQCKKLEGSAYDRCKESARTILRRKAQKKALADSIREQLPRLQRASDTLLATWRTKLTLSLAAIDKGKNNLVRLIIAGEFSNNGCVCKSKCQAGRWYGSTCLVGGPDDKHGMKCDYGEKYTGYDGLYDKCDKPVDESVARILEIEEGPNTRIVREELADLEASEDLRELEEGMGDLEGGGKQRHKSNLKGYERKYHKYKSKYLKLKLN